jgi:hypothetical protein
MAVTYPGVILIISIRSNHLMSHLHHHSAPLEAFNETETLQHHAPDPPSYWEFDADSSNDNHPALLWLHIFGMMLTFWVILPIGTVVS